MVDFVRVFENLKISHKLSLGFLAMVIFVAIVGGIGLFTLNTVGAGVDIILNEKVPIADASMEMSIAVVSGRDVIGEYLRHEDKLDEIKEVFESSNADFDMWRMAVVKGTDSLDFTSSPAGKRWAQEHGGETVIAVDPGSLIMEQMMVAEKHHAEFVDASYAIMAAHNNALKLKPNTRKKMEEMGAAAAIMIDKAVAGELSCDASLLWGQAMTANDYLVTGKQGEIDAFNAIKSEIETLPDYDKIEAEHREVVRIGAEMMDLQVEYLGYLAEEKTQMERVDEASAKIEGAMGTVKELTGADIAAVMAKTNTAQATRLLIVVIIVGLALAAGIGMFATRSITNPVNNLVMEIDNSAQSVAASAEELASSSEEMTASMEEMASAVQRISDGAQSQSGQAVVVSQEMENVGSMIKSIAENAQTATMMSEEANEIAKSGGKAAQEVTVTMGDIHAAVNESAHTLKELDQRSKEIDEIVDVITAIAEQTNLLALNAAIEAARAGEHGRGFAVVAEEVRKLAEGSAKAARQISGLIKEIQTGTDKAVESMSKGTEKVDLGSTAVKSALDETNDIVRAVESMANEVKEISVAIEEHNRATERVVKAIGEVAAMAEKTASSTKEMTAVTEQQTAGMQEISSSAQDLSNVSQRLQETVRRFKVKEAKAKNPQAQALMTETPEKEKEAL